MRKRPMSEDFRVIVAGMLVVLALHAAVLWSLWHYHLISVPQEDMTLFVEFIAPPAPKEAAPVKPLPQPQRRPVEKPRTRRLIAAKSATAPANSFVPPPKPEPIPAVGASPVSPPKPVGPLTLGSELSVSCPDRPPPEYPIISRRLGEEGTVTLRVELDEQGQPAAVRVVSSSGHSRLDEASVAAVRTWRCTPVSREGRAVRAVALQPFKFVLRGK